MIENIKNNPTKAYCTNKSINHKKNSIYHIIFAFAVFLIAVVNMAFGAAGDVYAAAADTQSKTYVTDNADILTDEQEMKLQKLCEKVSKECKCDVAIITLETGKDYSDLDDYIRQIIETAYGYDANADEPDAVVYAIDMISRADRIITSGIARTDISQSDLDSIREDAEYELADGYYYDGCKNYIDGIRLELSQSMMYKLTIAMPVKIIIAAVIALVSVLIMMHSAKSKMTVNSSTYSDNGFKLHSRQDTFINTTVVKREIETDNNGGGRSSGGGGNSGSSGGHF